MFRACWLSVEAILVRRIFCSRAASLVDAPRVTVAAARVTPFISSMCLGHFFTRLWKRKYMCHDSTPLGGSREQTNSKALSRLTTTMSIQDSRPLAGRLMLTTRLMQILRSPFSSEMHREVFPEPAAACALCICCDVCMLHVSNN